MVTSPVLLLIACAHGALPSRNWPATSKSIPTIAI